MVQSPPDNAPAQDGVRLVIKPRVRGFICVTTHPAGCEAMCASRSTTCASRSHRRRAQARAGDRRVHRLRPGRAHQRGLRRRRADAGRVLRAPVRASKPGTPGWHNSAAFHKFAQAEGLYARSINGDAFSDEIKRQVIEAIRADLGQVDQVVYSLAAPLRSHPRDGKVYTSVLKPVGRSVTLRGLDTDREVVRESTLEPATQDEIDATVAVMGGEDWQMWIDALLEAGVLAEGATTTAFTYLGERITHDIYWNGSIGAAKKDLDRKVLDIRAKLAARGGDARVSVLKAVVTQASSAIPMMPLYLSLLFKVMKAEGTHEGCIEQVYRLYRDGICGPAPLRDEEGRLRVDDWELAPAVQTRVQELWNQVETDNINALTDFAGYKSDFLRLFGFEVEGVDYEAPVNPHAHIDGLA